MSFKAPNNIIAHGTDIAFNALADNDVLTYSTANKKWTNKSPQGSATTSAKGVCIYNTGTNSYPVRPSGFGSVEFIGPVDPGNTAQLNDTWVNTA